jgi:hypothetical protein
MNQQENNRCICNNVIITNNSSNISLTMVC